MMNGLFKRLLLVLGIGLISWSCEEESYQFADIPTGVTIQDSYFVQIDLNNRKRDTFKVDIYMDGLASDENIFQFAATIPGTYSISDIGRFVRTFHVYDKAGSEIESEKVSTNQWLISNPENAFLIRYEVFDIWDKPVNENEIYRMASTSFEDDHALLNMPGVIGYINENRDRNYYINIKKPDLWTIATALRPTREGIYVANDFDHLVDSPILLADLSSAWTEIGNTQIGIHSYSVNEQISSTDIFNDIEQVMLDAEAFLGELPVDHYDYLFHFSDKNVGALEHAKSSVYVLRDGPYTDNTRRLLKGITAHEFFHIVTPLNIHSEVIENFNYVTPTPSAHLWLYEGVTEWASDMMQYRNGSMTIDELLSELERKATVANWYDPNFSLTDISLQSYTPEGHGQFVNIYHKGAMVANLLDIRLLQLSDGTFGLRDLILELIQTYGPHNSFSEDRFFETIVKLTYPEIEEFINDFIKGTEALPYTAYFEIIGISYDEDQLTFSKIDHPNPNQELLFNAWSINL